MDSSRALVEIGGKIFSGWNNLSATFDMDALCPVFDADYYDKTGDVHAEIKSGSEINLYFQMDDNSTPEILIPGVISKRGREKSGDSVSSDFEASHRLVDIVQCSAIVKSQTWRSKKFSRIISDILAPFSLKLNTSELTTDPTIEKFKLESGETAFDAIERLCRSQAVLPFASTDTDLHLTYSSGKFVTADENLEDGKNILSIRESEDYDERFSEYHGITQYPSDGKKWTREMLEGKQSAFDADVERYRPMLFIAENRHDRKTLAARVAWEAQIRAGRALEHYVMVKGWYQKDDNGRPIRRWKTNERTHLYSEDFEIDEDRLIVKVEHYLGDHGKITQLTLRHPDVYKPNPSERIKLS